MLQAVREFLSAPNSKLRVAVKHALPESSLRRLVGSRCEVETQTPVLERLFLYNAVSRSLWGSEATGKMLEVGSYHGASSVVMAEGIKRNAKSSRAQLFCIDTWQNDAMTEGDRDTWSCFQETIEPWKDLITPVRGYSNQVELPVKEALDLVFIDGDHTYEGCLADVERFAFLLRQGGRLVLHDHSYYAGVAQVLGELLQTKKWYVEDCCGNIIALVRDDSFSSKNSAVPSLAVPQDSKASASQASDFQRLDLPQKNIVLTTYFTEGGDPQGKGDVKANDKQAFAQWLPGLRQLGLCGIVFHDHLSQELISELEDENLRFVDVGNNQTQLSINDRRFLFWRDWLIANPCEKVFCTDLFDVRILKDPFSLIDDSCELWVSHEGVTIGENSWLVKKFQSLCGSVPEGLTGKLTLNAGLWGGRYAHVLRFLSLFVTECESIENMPYNSNMALFNHLMYHKIGEQNLWSKGLPFHSAFNAYEQTPNACFAHK